MQNSESVQRHDLQHLPIPLFWFQNLGWLGPVEAAGGVGDIENEVKSKTKKKKKNARDFCLLLSMVLSSLYADIYQFEITRK